MNRLSMLLPLLALAWRCGSSADQPPDRAANCQQGLANACQRLSDCGGAPPADPATVTFVANCIQALQHECTPDRLSCPPTETYHPDQDVACAAGFKEWSCAAILAADGHFPPPPAPCQQICQ